MAVVLPTLELERELLARRPLVIGLDEVGRGAIAGPVTVGACAIDASALAADMPEELRDSKLLSERRREALEPRVRAWALAVGTGSCPAADIDAHGIVACLATAAKRALVALHDAGVPVGEAIVLLDGSHDWLSPALSSPLEIVVRPKADRDCAVVAGASVVAKVERDAAMIARAADPGVPPYGWASNKGYGSAAHLAAIAEHGPDGWHRHTWLRA